MLKSKFQIVNFHPLFTVPKRRIKNYLMLLDSKKNRIIFTVNQAYDSENTDQNININSIKLFHDFRNSIIYL
ncbi:MAG: hypothetical protein LBT10_06020 [Methanobrevibacter sp.]|nr:hypothetical protein [Methanobrevibacter sp.]